MAETILSAFASYQLSYAEHLYHHMRTKVEALPAIPPVPAGKRRTDTATQTQAGEEDVHDELSTYARLLAQHWREHVGVVLRRAVLHDPSVVLDIVDACRTVEMGSTLQHIPRYRKPAQHWVLVQLATALKVAHGVTPAKSLGGVAATLAAPLAHVCSALLCVSASMPPALLHGIAPECLAAIRTCKTTEAWLRLDAAAVDAVISALQVRARSTGRWLLLHPQQ